MAALARRYGGLFSSEAQRDPVTSEAEVRAAMRAAWSEVMPGAELDETLTWQESGVDSLKSLHLLLSVETALRRPISFDLLTRETRIGDMIAILSGQGPSRQGETGRSTARRAYLVPGLYGDEPRLAEFRASLREDIAFETLQLPDLADPIRVTGDLHATAEYLADQVVERAQGGPVIVGGYSFGAHAAVATALALQARGVAVDWLCLFDPLPGPLPDWGAAKRAEELGARLGKAVLSPSRICTQAVNALVSVGLIGAARSLALMSFSPKDVEGAEKRRRLVLMRLRERAVGRWRPSPFRGRTILFATIDFERTGDPRPYLRLFPEVRIVRVNSDHLHIFEGEALHTITQALRTFPD